MINQHKSNFTWELKYLVQSFRAQDGLFLVIFLVQLQCPMSDCSHVSAAGVIVQWIPSKYGVMCRASCRLYTRYPSNEVFPVERMHLKHFIFDYVLHVRKDNLGRWAYVWKHVFLVKIKAVQYRDLELQFNEFSFSSYHFLYFCCCLI